MTDNQYAAAMTFKTDQSQPEPQSQSQSCQSIPSARANLDPYIRWMIRRDMPEVLDIESRSFEFPWSEHDFIRRLRKTNCIGQVAEIGPKDHEIVAGFMIYELHRTRLHLLSLAVHPAYRRRGVGTALTNKLIGKLSFQRRRRILLEVRETNLPAQQFFRRQEFRAISIMQNFYDDTPEDAYLMQYQLSQLQP